MNPELIESLRTPFSLAAVCILFISLLIYIWARIRRSPRETQVRRMSLFGVAFSLIVAIMAVYQSSQQIKSDQQYSAFQSGYSVHASVKGTITTATYSEPLSFRVSSGQINVGCNNSQSTNAVWSIPPSATEVQPTATWENTNNISTQTQNVATTSTQVIASGSISGVDRNFFGNCPGGGHGELVLKGTYRITSKESRGQQTIKTLDDKVHRGQPLVIAIPRDTNVVPESCDISVQEGSRRENIEIVFRVGTGGQLTIASKSAGNDIPVEVSLDQNQLTMVVM